MMARELYEKSKDLEGVTIENAPEANSVFAIIDNKVRDKMLLKYNFYTWDESKNLVRWMTSWDTESIDIDEFVAYLKTCL
jgi:threonine aldolase